MSSKVRIDLALLLPEVPDEQDACVQRLVTLLQKKEGIQTTHALTKDGAKPQICIHYDPNRITLAQVERLTRAAGAETTGQFGHAVLPIRIIDAEDASQRIESELGKIDGVIAVSANLPAQVVRVEFERAKTSTEKISAALEQLAYAPQAAPEVSEEQPTAKVQPKPGLAGWYAANRELTWSLVAGVLLLIGWVGERWFAIPQPVAIGIFAVSYIFGGFDLVRHSVGAVRRGKFALDIDLLMLLAAIGAAALGEWAEGAFLIFLFSLAHALEHYALGRARKAIEALAELAPPMARVLRDGREVETPVGGVAVGDVVVVRPAERIPTDGKVRSGQSSVNQAPITGESVPVDKAPEDDVFAGTINGEGALEVTTTRAAGDRTLDRVVKMVQEAQTQKAPTQRFTERFERIFVPLVLIADALLIFVPPTMGWLSWADSFYRAMALLVASSPCALALGTPSAVLAGIAQAARRGVLIKGGEHLENLGKLRAIALDKTGTLTVGKPEVTDLAAAEGSTTDELLRVAAAVERRSQHPLAQAVARRAESDQIAMPEAGELQSITARGVRSSVEGKTVEIGNLRLWEQDGIAIPNDVRNAVMALQGRGRSVMVVRHGERWLGTIGLADRPREGVREILGRLRNLGIRPIIMLTGDNRGVGEAIGKEVGVDEVRADLLPENKVTAIQELLTTHQQVAMVGDGVNDAPALANATVGIAMGGAGTAAALETADAALMGDDLSKLPFAVGLSRQARSVIRQNLYVSLTVIVLLVFTTISGVAGIGLAVLVHEGSTLVVIANALRLLAYNEEPIQADADKAKAVAR
ncbi:MAG: cadmium-translocating P-type ATPase [Bryobacteraceae bacterium]|nr:cadmium-translocating P-type ATPase [Bryobacteraceae bacterium]